MRVFGSNELKKDVIDTGLCIGCGSCVDLCPYFKNYRGKTAMLFSCTLPQGRCFAACPKIEVDLNELAEHFWKEPYQAKPLGEYEKIIASRAGINAPTGNFQAGGTVTALMTFAFDQGLIHAAALTGKNGPLPEPLLVTSAEEVAACGGSRFMAAPTMSVVNRAVRENYRRIGLVGTPCQMTGAAQMRTNPLDMDNFEDPVTLAVGLFCNWNLDQRALTAFLGERFDLNRITGMDIPPPPANTLVIKTDEGCTDIPLDGVKPLIPETCFICPDMTAEWADVSVGMFEGKPGWNTLIVRTEKGAELTAEAEKAGFLETAPMPVENISRLTTASADKKKRSFGLAVKKNLINTDEDGLRASLRVPADVLESVISQ